MNDPREIDINDYQYTLPEERIAKFPLPARDHSRLLVTGSKGTKEVRFHELPSLVKPGYHFYFNNTRVIYARLRFKKPTGGTIEIFLLAPSEGESKLAEAMSSFAPVVWKCFVGGAKRWKDVELKMTLTINGTPVVLVAKKSGSENESFLIEFSWDQAGCSFSEVLASAGEIPLPPYFDRPAEKSDEERYQTVFSNAEGSVAAPTAGLHFTAELLDQLSDTASSLNYITLHVGAGTFKPVTSKQVGSHVMHQEYFEIDISALEQLRDACDETIIPIGTTTLRTLESIYWLGEQCSKGELTEPLVVNQWEGFDTISDRSAQENISSLMDWMKVNGKEKLCAETSILIAPGYRFRIVSGLITNFHMPGSTLLLLVGAMTGKEWRQLYEYALNHEFRFLSYGDAMFIKPD